MTDLRIDYQLLDQVSANLGSLAGRFERIEATQDGYNSAMGSDLITSAMGGFAGNWSIHRGTLVDSMRALQQHTHDTKQQFSNADQGLGHQLAAKTK